MEWYIPLTMLPAVALIILSTSNFIVALNSELYQLEKDAINDQWVIENKAKQLRTLGIAISLLYTSTLFFLFSTLLKAVFDHTSLFKWMMVIAVLFVTAALIALFIHSIKAVTIREKHLKI
ncbi:hypothetical protein N9L92_02480 [Saprospiraceae bacterium]|nr:hypothetical protein [Saprospiraceae bacterium]